MFNSTRQYLLHLIWEWKAERRVCLSSGRFVRRKYARKHFESCLLHELTHDSQWTLIFVLWSSEGLWKVWNWTIPNSSHNHCKTSRKCSITLHASYHRLYLYNRYCICILTSYKVWLIHIPLTWADIWAVLQEVR